MFPAEPPPPDLTDYFLKVNQIVNDELFPVPERVNLQQLQQSFCISLVNNQEGALRSSSTIQTLVPSITQDSQVQHCQTPQPTQPSNHIPKQNHPSNQTQQPN